MSVFYGEYNYVMDEKNRIFVPSKFRNELKKENADYFMITIGLDVCLYAYLPSIWSDLIKNNMEVFKTNDKEQERAFKRYFFSNAFEAKLDDMGRILISSSHKSYASIKKDVVIIGAGNKIEIWAKEKWENYKKTKISKSIKKFSKILDI